MEQKIPSATEKNGTQGRLSAQLMKFRSPQGVVVVDSLPLAHHLSSGFSDTQIIGGGSVWQWLHRKKFSSLGKTKGHESGVRKDREINAKLYHELRINSGPLASFQAALESSRKHLVFKAISLFRKHANGLAPEQLLAIADSPEKAGEALHALLGVTPNEKQAATMLDTAACMKKEIAFYKARIRELEELKEEGLTRLLCTLAKADPNDSVAAYLSWRPNSQQKLHFYLGSGTKDSKWELVIREELISQHCHSCGFGIELHYDMPDAMLAGLPSSPPSIIATGPQEGFKAAKTIFDSFLSAMLRQPKAHLDSALVTFEEMKKKGISI